MFLIPDIYLKIYLENQKTPHQWTQVAKRIDIPGIDNIIVKNKALEIERKFEIIESTSTLPEKCDSNLWILLNTTMP